VLARLARRDQIRAFDPLCVVQVCLCCSGCDARGTRQKCKVNPSHACRATRVIWGPCTPLPASGLRFNP